MSSKGRIKRSKINNQPESRGSRRCFQRNMPGSFEEAKSKLILQIYERFKKPNYIIQSLRNGKKEELLAPVLRDPEDWTAKMKWRVEHELYKENLHLFEAEWLELCHLIIENCDDDIKNTIKDLPNFDSEIKNDPLMLLEMVETLMMDSTVVVERKETQSISLKDERIKYFR